jgi:membrane-bound serine protease (ClpP class)
MRDSQLDDGLDTEMDERLRAFARNTRMPALPDDVADLPWTVQLERGRTGPLGFLAGMGTWAALRRTSFGLARLGVILAVAATFLLLVGNTRTGGSGADLIQPPITPRPTSAVAAPSGREVVVVPVSGVVDDVMADHVAGAVHRAEADGAAAVIIQLDTLGGNENAMRRIVGVLHSSVPTIVWIGPAGARSGGAGTYITLAGNLAYMAPSTTLGGTSSIAASDSAVVYMSGIAKERHPDAEAWAASLIRDAATYSADDAVAAKAVNGIAGSIDELMTMADGKTVTTSAGQVVLNTKGATTVTIGEDFIQGFLHTLDDPNLAFILLVIGVLLVTIELFHPTLLMGLLGAMCLALAFYGAGSLPLNALGVVLVVIGIGLLILEPNVPSHGLLTIGGIAAFVVGARAFYGSPGPYMPVVAVAWPIILIMAAAAGAYGLVIVSALVRLRNQPVPVGAGLVGIDGVVGLVGKVQADLAPVGTVYVGREAWSAKTEDGSALKRNDKVRVIRQEGLTLIVRKVE